MYVEVDVQGHCAAHPETFTVRIATPRVMLRTAATADKVGVVAGDGLATPPASQAMLEKAFWTPVQWTTYLHPLT